MKIFMSNDFFDSTISIQVRSDNNSLIVLHGIQSREYGPIYGCELNEGEQDKLLQFLLENQNGTKRYKEIITDPS